MDELLLRDIDKVQQLCEDEFCTVKLSRETTERVFNLARLGAAVEATPGGQKLIHHEGTSKKIFGEWTLVDYNKEKTLRSANTLMGIFFP